MKDAFAIPLNQFYRRRQMVDEIWGMQRGDEQGPGARMMKMLSKFSKKSK